MLGGNGPVVSAYTDVPEASIVWLDYWTSEETLKRDAAKYALPPTMPQLYDDESVVKTLPYAKELLTAVENATSRPVSPVYPQISTAIYKNVNAAIGGPAEPGGRAEERPGRDREGALQLLMAPVELLIAGGGSRGATFAGWAARHPERARVVAVAEPRADRRDALADAHGVQPDLRFADWREALANGPVADAAVVATLDREHTEPALALAEQGYALLIEKPLATDRGRVRGDRRGDRARRRGGGGRARPALHAVHAARAAAARRAARSATWSASSTSSRSASGTTPTPSCAATGAARTRPGRCCWPSAATTSTGSRTS